MNQSEKFWNKTARKYAKGPIKDMAGYEKTLEDTRKYLGSDKTVLEFGCGTGTTALKLASSTKDYTATDLSSEMIAIANEKKREQNATNVSFVQATLEDDVLKEGSYDVILGYNIVHLLPDPAAALKRIQSLLKPGGVFISKTACLRESWFWPLIVPIVAK
ncbi:MAG: class I SAM-dependent methyltransferase, partial [Candidatus Omnitrophica bacterium]|nr:class I SAM-dependent methyltransferase [Candidatus Omnitrophota bacterium]